MMFNSYVNIQCLYYRGLSLQNFPSDDSLDNNIKN